MNRKSMDVATLSSKFQLVIPRGPRERLRLRPGMRFTVIEKGGILFLVPERTPRALRGIARGTDVRDLREKRNRL